MLVQAQAQGCQQEKSAWREKSRQPKKPKSQAFPSRALPRAGRSSSHGNTARAPGGCIHTSPPSALTVPRSKALQSKPWTCSLVRKTPVWSDRRGHVMAMPCIFNYVTREWHGTRYHLRARPFLTKLLQNFAESCSLHEPWKWKLFHANVAVTSLLLNNSISKGQPICRS